MVAESKAKWIGLSASSARNSLGGAGRGAGGGGAGAATGGGAGATGAGAGAGAGGGGAAGAGAGAGAGAWLTVATGRFAHAETNRSPTMIEARIERSRIVRTLVLRSGWFVATRYMPGPAV